MLFWNALLYNKRKQTVVQHAEKATAQIDTFAFAPNAQDNPSVKPKEPLFANALMTFFTNIKLTLPKKFKNRK